MKRPGAKPLRKKISILREMTERSEGSETGAEGHTYILTTFVLTSNKTNDYYNNIKGRISPCAEPVSPL